jgi:FkbM family methyltransferase
VTPISDQMFRKALRERGLVAVPDRGRPEHLAADWPETEVIVDVGVDTGTPHLYNAFPDRKFVLIDPRAEAEHDTLANGAPRDYDFHACAVGAASGTLALHIPTMRQGPNPAMAGFKPITGRMGRTVTGYETRLVPVVPLDRIMQAYPGRVGLKIDTEGYELEVLQGASETLPRCDFVILELSVTHRYDDLAPPSRVVAELAQAGLELRDILRSTGDGRGGAQPRLFDALFTRWEARN